MQEEWKKFNESWVTYDEDDIETSITITRCIEEAKRYLSHMYEKYIPNTYLQDFSMILDNIAIAFSDFCRLRTAREFQKTPELFSSIFTSNKDNDEFWKDDFQLVYGLNSKENRTLFAREIYRDFLKRKIKRNQLLEMITNKREETTKFFSKINSLLVEQGTQYTISSYSKSIAKIINILHTIGVLDRQIDRNNSDRRGMGLGVLCFSATKDSDSSRYSVEHLRDEEFLKKLPLETLVPLYAFYSNRLTKVTQSISTGLFLCEKLNDYDVNNKNIDMSKATKVYSQYKWIERNYTAVMNSSNFDVMEYVQEYNQKRNVYQFDFEEFYTDFFENYEKIYALKAEGSADLKRDAQIYVGLNSDGYNQKNWALETALLIAMESFEKINWGYIPEIEDGKNSIERNRKMILLGFDVPGLNMPIRLHMPVEMVKEILKGEKSKVELPNYIGDEDFNVYNQNISSQIIVPFSPKHRKELKDAVDEMKPQSAYYNFAKHIKNIQYDNNLSRILRWKMGAKKGVPRTYTNMKNGKTRQESKSK